MISGGGFLSFLTPTGASGLDGDSTPFLRRHGFESALAANAAPFSAHFSHDLRDEGFSGGRRLCGRSLTDGLQNDAAGILNGVQLGRAFPLWHGPRSHGHGRFVKLEAISN